LTTTPDDRAPIDPSAAPRAATSTEPSIDPRLAEGDCTVPLSADVDPSAWPEPVQALAHTPGSGARPTSLAELTTLRVGGPVGSYVEATTQSELTEAIREADAAGTPAGSPLFWKTETVSRINGGEKGKIVNAAHPPEQSEKSFDFMQKLWYLI